MGILFYLLSLQERVLRRLEVICLRKVSGTLGQGSLLNPGAIISFPNKVFNGDDVSIASGVHLGASNQAAIPLGGCRAIASGTRRDDVLPD